MYTAWAEWAGWRGPPDLVAQIARAASWAVGAGTCSIEIEHPSRYEQTVAERRQRLGRQFEPDEPVEEAACARPAGACGSLRLRPADRGRARPR